MQTLSPRSGRGALAIVLHTHMPYVEGFGTWPFGEEWLWEAMATSYLPLLDVLERGPGLTLSLTPVLGDQLCAPGVAERFAAFTGELRAHELALRAGWDALHARLGVTRRFYDWFTPAIAVSDFALRPLGQARMDAALDFVAVCRP